jgi:hypothetical protein
MVCTCEGPLKEKIRDGEPGLKSKLDALEPDEPTVFDVATTLRDVKVSMITIECRACGRSDAIERRILVRKHGADMSFARLRRMAAMGCDRLMSDEGDRCQTRFPCLEQSADQQGTTSPRRSS